MTYYVYEHWRPDKGVCFYVGKGKGKRAWDMAQARGVSEKTREAQRAAVTGKKRPIFSAETIKRMSDAAKIREAKKRLLKEAA